MEEIQRLKQLIVENDTIQASAVLKGLYDNWDGIEESSQLEIKTLEPLILTMINETFVESR